MITDNLRLTPSTSSPQADASITFDIKQHKTRIMNELRALGVSRYGLLKFETRCLPTIIHPFEHIGGVVYGRHTNGSVMLVATDCRVIFIDKKLFSLNEDEISYDVVSGVSYGRVGLIGTVTLHTRINNYAIRVLNQTCANNFVHYIEHRCLEHLSSSSHVYDY